MNSLVLDHGPVVAAATLFAIFTVRSLVVAGGAQLWTLHAAWPRTRLVVALRDLRTDWRRDVKRGILILAYDAAVFGALAHLGFFSRGAGAAELLLTTLAYFVWFEIYFYFAHRALHHRRLYWIHRYHHEGRGTNPWTSLAFSFSERAILHSGVYIPVFLLAPWHPVSFEGFGLYFLLNYVFNVNGHLNVELLPRWVRNTPLFPVTSTATSHSLHHLRFQGNYGLFTQVLDRLFGTDFPDYPEVFDRVVAGDGAIHRR